MAGIKKHFNQLTKKGENKMFTYEWIDEDGTEYEIQFTYESPDYSVGCSEGFSIDNIINKNTGEIVNIIPPAYVTDMIYQNCMFQLDELRLERMLDNYDY